MFKIIIFSADEDTFLKKKYDLEKMAIRSENIIWCDSGKRNRIAFINDFVDQWLFFIDYDCVICQDVLDCIRKLISLSVNPSNLVFAGSYSNPIAASYFQKAHNFIANSWLEQSYSGKDYKLILGGVFLIYSSQMIKNDEEILFWGAEDKFLSHRLNELKFKMNHINELSVLHETNSSCWHFLRRAYLHGRNEVKYIKNNKNKISYLFWIRKIGFVNLSLLPLVLLHFCIQKAAKLIQTVRH